MGENMLEESMLCYLLNSLHALLCICTSFSRQDQDTCEYQARPNANCNVFCRLRNTHDRTPGI